MSIVVAILWRILSPKTKIVYWCFDLYPEAAIADGLFSNHSFLARLTKGLLRPAYRACSVIADIGPCMRRLLLKYPSDARRVTIVPWALDEPVEPLVVDSDERQLVFGKASLAILYSGSFGRAHSYAEMLDLAQAVEPSGVRLAFSVTGNREAELRQAVQDRHMDIRFLPLAPFDRLRNRLACADVHVVALRSEWTGTVVPSKFFGALAVGRPILFAGDPDSSIAGWINTYRLGWVLTSDNSAEIAASLTEYSANPERQREMNRNCFDVYQRFFSKDVQLRLWDGVLRSLLPEEA